MCARALACILTECNVNLYTLMYLRTIYVCITPPTFDRAPEFKESFERQELGEDAKGWERSAYVLPISSLSSGGYKGARLTLFFRQISFNIIIYQVYKFRFHIQEFVLQNLRLFFCHRILKIKLLFLYKNFLKKYKIIQNNRLLKLYYLKQVPLKG